MGKYFKAPKLKMPKLNLNIKGAMPKLNLRGAFDLKPPTMHNLKIPSIGKVSKIESAGHAFVKPPKIESPPKIEHPTRLSKVGIKGAFKGAFGKHKKF